MIRAIVACCALELVACATTDAGRRLQLEDRGRLCRAGTVSLWQCQACMARAQQACEASGLSDCQVQDTHEPERSCF